MPHRLRDLRRARGLTQAQLGALVGKEGRTVQKQETEAHRLRVSDLKAYAKALDCRISDIIEPPQLETEDERELLEIVRGLSRADRERFLKIARALNPEDDGAPAKKSA